MQWDELEQALRTRQEGRRRERLVLIGVLGLALLVALVVVVVVVVVAG